MLGLMMQRPLLISSLIDFAALNHGTTEIVSRTVEGPIHRYTYADSAKRAKKLANALTALGVEPGDRIATLGWNGYRHFEIYYGVSGIGAVCHTINPRLFPPQIAYIMNHAADRYLFIDLTFLPLIEAIIGYLKHLKGIVVMTDEQHMPKSEKLPNLLCYETLLADQPDAFEWPEFDENTASSLCYTSGTTGDPKGVLYSHRSTLLHTFAICMTDVIGLSAQDSVLPVVPMFHVNAWGLPYAACMTGCKVVFPGPKMDGASLHELMEQEKVTLSAGVPTIWLGLLTYMRQNGKKLPLPHRSVIGGSAAPRAMIETFQKEYGAHVIHAWGMTEISPVGTAGAFKGGADKLSEEERLNIQAKQGRAIYGVEMKVTGPDGKNLPRDGVSFGNLKVRGPWVCSSYFGEDSSPTHQDSWFDTGDVGTLDADGFMQITDRSKDVIKSGGEWISSIDLENLAMAHPEVGEAAAIAVPHPKWDERPVLVVVRKPDSSLTRDQLLAFFEGKIAKWWMPDDVIFVNELPHTATGKLLKTKLRDDYRDYRLPGVA